MAVVGTAYVIVKAITKNLGDDIAKQVSKSGVGDAVTKEVTKSVEKSGLGKRVSEIIAKDINKNDSRGRLRVGFSRLWKSLLPNADNGGRGIGRRLGQSITGGLKKVKIPKVVWLALLALPALGGVIKIAVAYVGALTSLVSALGPAAAGAGLGVVALYGAVAQVFGVVKLLGAKTPILERFKEAVASIGEQWTVLATRIQKKALPAIAGAFQRISDELIPAIGDSLVDTGSVIGRIAKQFAALTATPLFQSRLKGVVDGNNKALAILGKALISSVSILVTLLNAANPLLIQFANAFASGAKKFGAFLDEADRTGQLAGWIETMSGTLSQLGRIAKGTFGGLAGVFKAAYGPGRILLNNIEKMTDRFNEWANSLAGQSTLKTFFYNALPIVREFNGLIGDLLKLTANGIIGNNQGTIDFIRLMRTDLVPVLATAAGTISRTLGPSLIDLAGAFATFLTALSNSGALGAFVNTLAFLFETIAAFFSLPVIGQIAGFVVSILGIAKAVSFVFAPLGFLVDVLLFLAPIIIRIILFVGRFVLAMNPWVAAIIAVVTVLVLLYRNSETFRRIVQVAWQAVLTAGKALWTGLVAAFNFILAAARNLWTVVSTVFNAIASVVITVFSTIWNAIQPVVSLIGTVIVTYLRIMAKAWEIAFKIIQLIVVVAIGVIIIAFRLLWSVVRPIVRAIASVVVAVFTRIRDFITTVVGAIVRIVGPRFRAVYDVISTVVGNIRDRIQTVFRAIRDFFTRIFAAIRGIAETGWGLVESGASTVAGAIKGVLNTIIGFINAAVHGLNTVINAANKLPGPDIGVISEIPKLAKGAYVKARPGGIVANIGEGIYDEIVLPLSPKVKKALAGGGVTVANGGIMVDARGSTDPAGTARLVKEGVNEALEDLYRRIKTG